MTTITEPGIYPGTSMEVYRSIEAVNASCLKYAAKSMAHVKAALDGRLKFSSDATDFGNLVHTLTLEPDAYKERYIVEADLSQFKTKAGKASDNPRGTEDYKKWVASQAPKVVIAQEDLDRARVCEAEVKASRRAQQMLGAEGQNEVVIVWRDEKTGVLCKCRVDRLTDSWIVDLKTTRDAGRVFEKQVSQLDYLLSGAFYRRGAAAADGIVRPVGLVAVDTSEVCGVRVAPLDSEQMNESDARIDAWLAQVRVCQLSGVWPWYESPDAWRAADWVNNFEPTGLDDEEEEPQQAAAGGW